MHKLWVVLKVSLTRPWVWLNCLICVPMIFLQVNRTQGIFKDDRPYNMRAAIPAFDEPEQTFRGHGDFSLLNDERWLSRVEGMNLQYHPDEQSFFGVSAPSVTPAKEPTLAVIDDPRAFRQGDWKLLDKVPQLKTLVMKSPNKLNAAGWQRIGRLSRLESLSLEDVNPSDSQAKRSGSADLQAALAQLTNLRQLKLVNTGGHPDWTLPPLPRLEYVVLGLNKQLEASLDSLAAHSPGLNTLVLHTTPGFVYTEPMLSALQRMQNLEQIFVVVSLKRDEVVETSRQMTLLRNRLPGIQVSRGVYWADRVSFCNSMIFPIYFFTFTVWLQAGMMLSLPLAAVMPGHRRPHLFWPIVSVIGAIAFWVVATSLYRVDWATALALGILITMSTALTLPGQDLSPAWRRTTGLIAFVEVICGLSLITSLYAVPAFADEFLIGGYPLATSLLLLWGTFSAAWKLWRAGRLHRIFAESGMTAVPGIQMGGQQPWNSQPKSTAERSWMGWRLMGAGNAFDRRLSAMNRSDWSDMLRRGNPASPVVFLSVILFLFFIVMYRYLVGVMFSKSTSESIVAGLTLVPMVMQFTLFMLGMKIQVWMNRRGTLAADFLRPVSRPVFWRSLRLAIFYDLMWPLLLGGGGGLLAICLTSKAAFSSLTVVNAILSTIGLLGMTHGLVLLLVISKQRLWIYMTLLAFVWIATVAVAGASVWMTMGDRAAPLLAVSLAVGVLLAGAVMQWGVTRRLPDYELG